MTMPHSSRCLGFIASALLAAFTVPVGAAQDTADLALPDGYRNWLHHHSTVNMTGHAPESNVGIQHVYANDKAAAGLAGGSFEDGATFVVDRFAYHEGDNHTLSQANRKVIAIMVRDAARFAETGGWGFQAFKGGDPARKVVKDGGATCFACHAPHAENHYLFTRNAP